MKTYVRMMVMCGLLGGMLAWTGCSTAWISEVQKIVEVLIPATANLVTLVTTLQGSFAAEDLQTIQSVGAQSETDLQVLQTLIARYQKADVSAQSGLLAQIQYVITAVQANMNGLLPALHVKDPATQAKVSAVVGLVLSEVESIAAIIPAADSSATNASLIARQSWPLSLNANRFVSSYNATMVRKTGNLDLDRATSGLRIHAHGKLERLASLGFLN
jgi:hypothetical protein